MQSRDHLEGDRARGVVSIHVDRRKVDSVATWRDCAGSRIQCNSVRLPVCKRDLRPRHRVARKQVEPYVQVVLFRRPLIPINISQTIGFNGDDVVLVNRRIFLEEQCDELTRLPSGTADHRPLAWRVIVLIRLDRREAVDLGMLRSAASDKCIAIGLRRSANCAAASRAHRVRRRKAADAV